MIIRLVMFCFMALFIAFGDSYVLNQKCQKGQEYWCDSIEKANECNAFKYCLSNVWSKKIEFLASSQQNNAQTLSPNKCIDCIQCLTADLRQCPYIRLYQDEINQLLSSDVTRQAVCTLLMQCEYVESNKIEENSPQILSYCGIEPKKWCDSIENAKQCSVFDYCLANWSKSSIKYKVKQIAENAQNESSIILNRKDADPQKLCAFCLFVFDKIEYVVGGNATESMVRVYLESACIIWPDEYLAKKCLITIDKYITEIFSLVRGAVQPGLICQVLNVCNETTLEINNQEQLEIKINFAKSVKANDVLIKKDLSNKEAKDIPNNVNCSKCKLVIENAKHLLQINVSDNEIVDYLNNYLCENANPGKSKLICKALFNSYTPFLFEIILKYFSSSQLCTFIGYCRDNDNNGTRILDISDLNKNFPKQVEKIDRKMKTKCALCEFFVTILTKLIGSRNSTEKEIERALIILCEQVPEGLRDDCDDFVEEYAPMVISVIFENLRPDIVCSVIGVCDDNVDPAAKRESCVSVCWNDRKFFIDPKIKKQALLGSKKQSQKKQPFNRLIDFKSNKAKIEYLKKSSDINGTIECSLCIYVSQVTRSLVTENKTSDKVLNELNLICNFFPLNLKNQCLLFINQKAPYVVELITAELDPEGTCSAMNLCAKDKNQITVGEEINWIV